MEGYRVIHFLSVHRSECFVACRISAESGSALWISSLVPQHDTTQRKAGFTLPCQFGVCCTLRQCTRAFGDYETLFFMKITLEVKTRATLYFKVVHRVLVIDRPSPRYEDEIVGQHLI
jgi:hypothetical protein